MCPSHEGIHDTTNFEPYLNGIQCCMVGNVEILYRDHKAMSSMLPQPV